MNSGSSSSSTAAVTARSQTSRFNACTQVRLGADVGAPRHRLHSAHVVSLRLTLIAWYSSFIPLAPIHSNVLSRRCVAVFGMHKWEPVPNQERSSA